jgi:D-alanine-D-alanine ligase-like ATP-grasp enzyme
VPVPRLAARRSRSNEPDRLVNLIDSIARSGRIGSEIAVRLDLVRSTGIGHAWRRVRGDARLSKESGSIQAAYRTIWQDAAAEVGADLIDLGSGFLEVRRDGRATRVRNNLVMLDDSVTLQLALDKLLVHGLLKEKGIPIAGHVGFGAAEDSPALSFLMSRAGPCIVKPAASSAGYGVTGGIRSVPQFLRARLRAARIDQRLIIEEQLPGDVYRLLFLDGQLLDVVRRHPPRVVGDGRSTIEELIAKENSRRAAGPNRASGSMLRVDLDSIFRLEEAGLTVRSVPPFGSEVVVKTVISQNSSEENETVREFSDGFVAEARAAVAAVGLRLGGVDAVTADPMRSMSDTGGAVIEVNGPPGFGYHYDVREPQQATRVAVPILEACLAHSSPRTPLGRRRR